MPKDSPRFANGPRAVTRFLLVFMLGSLLAVPCFSQAADTIYTIPVTRTPLSGYTGPLPVTQSFILTPQAPIFSTTVIPPSGVAILLAGGDGNIHLTAKGPSPSDGTLSINSSNFLVRSRWLFASRNFVVVTLDSAIDFQATTGGLTGNQGNPAHVSDVEQVISWARTTYPGLKVWLVGTSRGTAGAWVAGTSTLPTGPDGVVFTSPINGSGDPDSLLAAPLSMIGVPTLIVSDTKDACPGTAPSADAAVAALLTASPKVSVIMVTGGNFAPLDAVCDARSAHGFFGIEPRTVTVITAWMKLY